MNWTIVGFALVSVGVRVARIVYIPRRYRELWLATGRDAQLFEDAHRAGAWYWRAFWSVVMLASVLAWAAAIVMLGVLAFGGARPAWAKVALVVGAAALASYQFVATRLRSAWYLRRGIFISWQDLLASPTAPRTPREVAVGDALALRGYAEHVFGRVTDDPPRWLPVTPVYEGSPTLTFAPTLVDIYEHARRRRIESADAEAEFRVVTTRIYHLHADRTEWWRLER